MKCIICFPDEDKEIVVRITVPGAWVQIPALWHTFRYNSVVFHFPGYKMGETTE